MRGTEDFDDDSARQTPLGPRLLPDIRSPLTPPRIPLCSCSVPLSNRGAFRDRHGRWGGMRWTCSAVGRTAWARTAKSRGPDPPTLGSSQWGDLLATEAIKPGTPGRARISRKTIANSRTFYLRTRGCGCGQAPGIPCALAFRGPRMTHRPGRPRVAGRRLASDEGPGGRQAVDLATPSNQNLFYRKTA
jgi:hypothetical protein